MKIALEFTYHTDIISVPDDIGKNIKKYQLKFDKWLYDKDINHGNWIVKNGKKFAVSFDTKTFVDYLNNVHLCNMSEKAIIIQENAQQIAKDVPALFF